MLEVKQTQGIVSTPADDAAFKPAFNISSAAEFDALANEDLNDKNIGWKQIATADKMNIKMIIYSKKMPNGTLMRVAGELPDFPRLGVELKTIPLKPDGKPSESTFICSIDMALADRSEWESSRLRRRLQCVLFLPLDSSKTAPLADRRFGHARLWQPDSTQWRVLQADWEDLMGAIGSGRGGTLSAREGAMLQVRPKASNASVRTMAPCAAGVQQTLPLGFYMRAHATHRILGDAL